MKKIYLVLLVMFCAAISLEGQLTYTSADNSFAAWEDAATWTKSGTVNGSDTDSPDLNSYQYAANVNGCVTRAGNIIMSNSSTLNIYDTLVIDGDLLPSAANVNVHETGLLIILGNFSSSNLAKFVNKGRVVLAGTFYSTGSATLDNHTGSEFFLFGTADIDNMAVVDGCDANRYDATPRTCDIMSSFKSKEDLKNKYPNIHDFIESGGTTTLPVNLLYFKVTAQKQSIEIRWASSKAWDFSHYELERSEDGKNFYYLSTIDAEENSNTTETYSHTDRQPVSGTSYYRLKAVDIDGKYEYKGVEVVKFGAHLFKVYPNPSTGGYIHISLSQTTAGEQAVSLKDNSGRTVYTTLQSGNNISIRTTGIPAGMYLLSVQDAAGIQQTQVVIR